MSSVEEIECTPPCNFSWVVKEKLAAMGCPQSESNLRYIASEGIKHLVTLSPEQKPPMSLMPELMWTEIPVMEFEAPTINQINHFINICENCENVGVHCRQGKGRTGVMAACYLVYFQDLAPERAITNIRLQRPGSIETYEQEQIVIKYHLHLRTSS